MSLVATSHKTGKLEVKNRFVPSAAYESIAEKTGKVTDRSPENYGFTKQSGLNASHPALNYAVKWKFHYDLNHQRSIDFQPSTALFAARGP
jgi:hypothetical protein